MSFALFRLLFSIRRDFFYESRKYELAEYLWKIHAQNDLRHLDPVGECLFVIDGGALLYQIDWQKSKLFLTDTFNISVQTTQTQSLYLMAMQLSHQPKTWHM